MPTAMGPGQYVGFVMLTLILLQTCPVSGRPSSNIMDGHGQQGTKECDHKFSMNVSQGDSASLTLPINTEKQIVVSHYDFQKHKETKLLVGLPNYLHRRGSKTEVSLVNQNFTLQNVKKAAEGLYQIKEYNDERCLAQVNVSVFDPPPSPGTTNLPIAKLPPEQKILVCALWAVLVVVSVIINLDVLV